MASARATYQCPPTTFLAWTWEDIATGEVAGVVGVAVEGEGGGEAVAAVWGAGGVMQGVTEIDLVLGVSSTTGEDVDKVEGKVNTCAGEACFGYARGVARGVFLCVQLWNGGVDWLGGMGGYTLAASFSLVEGFALSEEIKSVLVAFFP